MSFLKNDANTKIQNNEFSKIQVRAAIYNPFFEVDCAEKELIKRFIIAGKAIGLEIEEVSSTGQVNLHRPDFIFSMHHNTPKLCGIPTYGCMWNPPQFLEVFPESIPNIMSLDGYLASGPVIDRWIKDLLFASEKEYFITPFYASCHGTQYRPLDFKHPRLMYCGTNWDGPRFKNLFEALDRRSYMAIYGPKHRWTHINNAYKGDIPFDGTSILERLQEAGVGLCLHREEHMETGVPSMRIFEIVAASAVAICQEHPFIRKIFGNNVLYIDVNDRIDDARNQIDQHIHNIEKHPEQMREMTARAHQIFLENFTLEKMLHGVLEEHSKLQSRKFSPVSIGKDGSNRLVQVVMRVGGRSAEFIRRALESILAQTYHNLEIIMVSYQEVPGLVNLIEEYRGKLVIKSKMSKQNGFRSTTLWDGLSLLSGDYFALLDDDDIYFPNHLATLIKILERHKEVNLSYSGSVRMLESEGSTSMDSPFYDKEGACLAYFPQFDPAKLWRRENYITSNSWVARTSALEPWMLSDPEMIVAEDLFLLLCLLKNSRFIFSFEVTCCFFWRKSKNDNGTFLDAKFWEVEYKRLDFLIRHGLAPTMSALAYQDQISTLKQQISELQQYITINSSYIPDKSKKERHYPHLKDGFVDPQRKTFFSIRWIFRHPKLAIPLIIRQPRKTIQFAFRNPKIFFTQLRTK